MLQIEEAVKQLQKQVTQKEHTEQMPLLEAAGRILAEDAVAEKDQPPFPRSPLDGYALRGEETAGASREHPAIFRVTGKVCAGEWFPGRVQKGEAVRIMTGAPVPEGADTVIRQEDTDYGEETIQVFRASAAFENYCPQGEDYRTGTVLLKKGRRLDGAATAILAGMGRDSVRVYGLPRVAVISTGDEVVPPGHPLERGKIYDSNRYYLCARMQEKGLRPERSMHCRDNAAELAGQIREMCEEGMELIVTTGGVSVGEKDILHETLELLGARRLFWRIDVKPGAPVMAAVCQNTLLICLSGNPYGAAVNFELLVRPVLEVLTGSRTWRLEKRQAVLQNDFRKKKGTRRFLRGREENGKVWVAAGNQASGALSSLAESNCLVEITKEMAGATKGETVWVYLL